MGSGKDPTKELVMGDKEGTWQKQLVRNTKAIQVTGYRGTQIPSL